MYTSLKALMIILATGLYLYADHGPVEVGVKKVFVPPSGFDDNDNIQLIVDGVFPNQCYKILDSKVEIDKHTKVILVRQFAEHRHVADCTSNSVPDHLNYPSPFTNEIELGRLPAGRYTVKYKSGVSNQQLQERKFEIRKSQTEGGDDFIYAPVTDAFIPEMVYETKNAEVLLTGVIDSSCLNWKEISVERLEDVIVVMPKMRLENDRQHCVMHPVPLEKIVSIGDLKKGRYLLHVRSIAGKSVNRVFTVIERPTNPGAGL